MAKLTERDKVIIAWLKHGETRYYEYYVGSTIHTIDKENLTEEQKLKWLS